MRCWLISCRYGNMEGVKRCSSGPVLCGGVGVKRCPRGPVNGSVMVAVRSMMTLPYDTCCVLWYCRWSESTPLEEAAGSRGHGRAASNLHRCGRG